MLQYQVEIVTGDHWAASTDANMYITLYGSRGDSGRRLLHNCTNNRVKFQRGQVVILFYYCTIWQKAYTEVWTKYSCTALILWRGLYTKSALHLSIIANLMGHCLLLWRIFCGSICNLSRYFYNTDFYLTLLTHYKVCILVNYFFRMFLLSDINKIFENKK